MKSYTITVNGVSYDVTVEEKSNVNQNVSYPTSNTSNTINSNANINSSGNMNSYSNRNLYTSNDNQKENTNDKLQKEESTQSQSVPKPMNQSSGDKKIEAPMPGKILAIKVSLGQTFKKGEVLFILEAMKLENEIVASEDGTIASIHVTSGEGIESGVILATYN